MSREHGGVVSRPDVDQLRGREAWLLDHQRLDEWLGLFTDDAVYWVPLQMDQAEPFTTASLIYDDRRLLEIRVRQTQHPRAHARVPAPRTGHHVPNVQVGADEGPRGAVIVILVGVAATSAWAQDNGTVRFAYLRLGWSATEIIQQEKLLEKRGWKVEWSVIDPIPGLVNAFAAGHADVIDMSTVL